MSQMSVSDVLAAEVTAFIEAPLFKLDVGDQWNSSLPLAAGKRDVMQELEDQGKPFKHLCKNLEGLKEELKKRQEASVQVIKDLNDQSKANSDLDVRLERLLKENRNKRSALEAMEAKVKTKGNQLDLMKEQLEEYSGKIEQHLGLNIVVLKGETARFLVTFDNVGSNDGGGCTKCTCELSLDEDTKLYKIGKVHPPIIDDDDDEFVDKMQNLLNETNDISGFVVTLRKKFKAAFQSH